MATLEQPSRRGLAGYDPAWDGWLARAYTLNWEVIVYLIIFLLAIFTRFYELGDRVMSHDESLHTYYSWLLYDRGEFQHTPLMHGPVIFHAVAFFYFLFGDSDFSARIYAAVLGVGIVMFPYLFRRWLGRTGAVFAAIGILISPMMMYYSRYIREDIPNIFFWLVMVYAVFEYFDGIKPRRPIWLIVFSGATLLMMASKETGFMYVAIFGSFLTFYWVLRLIQEVTRHPHTLLRPPNQTVWKSPRLRTVLGHLSLLAIALILGYLGSHVIWYWHFAQMSWAWVAIGAGLVLFIRALILVWDTGTATLQDSSNTTALFHFLLAMALLFGLGLFLIGSLTYATSPPQTSISDEQLIVAPEGTIEDNGRSVGTGLAVVGLIFVIGSGVALILKYWSVPEDTPRLLSQNWLWLLNTILAFAGVATLLALIKLLTAININLEDVLWSRTSDTTIQKLTFEPIYRLLVIGGLFIALESVGLVRSLLAGQPRPGLGVMLMEGLGNSKSASLIIIAGVVLGAVIAVQAYAVLDVVKPDQVWIVRPDATDTGTSLPSLGEVGNPARIELKTDLGNALLLWIGLPILASIILVIVIALIRTPAHVPMPWGEILSIFLVAVIVGGVLKYAERHSYEIEGSKSESADSTIAVDPNEQPNESKETVNDRIIIFTMLAFLLASAAVVGWRLFWPASWEFLNRQPAFDVLIMMGTLILPWLVALPLFRAGYVLDQIPPSSETIRAMLMLLFPAYLLVTVIGCSWNWKVWIPATVVFMVLLVFFFTTVFTNGVGILTGVVNSLGYWLEQQDVRRGSQPQYYYTWLQMPIYEYLPTLLAAVAGMAGLWHFFGWRANAYILAEAEAAKNAQPTEESTEEIAFEESGEAPSVPLPDEFSAVPVEERYWARPYSHDEELLMRESSPAWLGSPSFLQFVAYWGVLMIIALTIAGEKMPWLTTHISIPLIFAGGWVIGHVIERLDFSALRRGGWVLLLCLIPVAGISLLSLIGPLMGGSPPFKGTDQTSLGNTNAWLAALLVFCASVYFIVRLGRSIGTGQTSRLAFLSVSLMLALLTARAAITASFINYDYPTEFLVYAHSGDAVKIALNEIILLGERTNERENLKVAYDDDSSWPMTWYMRGRENTFFAGEAEQLEANPGVLDGARVVIVGNKKNAAVERILGNNYYRFDYKRLWWPMQEYFHLNYTRLSNLFRTDNPASGLYREGLWDIWWNRDYQKYAQAQCSESRLLACSADTNPETCRQNAINECQNDNRYDISRWPVSDAMYVYIDKELAVQIWDSGLGGVSVAQRLPQSAIERVYQEVTPLMTIGTIAQLNSPRAADIGPDGNLYVADSKNNRVVVIDAAGNPFRWFGETIQNNEVGLNTLFEPWGLAVSPVTGEVFVADTWNHRIVVFSPEGEALRTFGGYGTPDDAANLYSFFGPREVAIDRNGLVYVADTGGKRIRVYTPESEHVQDIGSGGTGLGQLEEPVGVAVNPINDEIYVADTWNQRIQAFSQDGTALRSFDVPMWYNNQQQPDRPYLAVSPDGRLIAVSDMNAVDQNDGPRVVVYDLAGNVVFALNAPETDFSGGLHGVRNVAGLAFGADGSLFAVDSETNRIVQFPPLPVTGGIVPNLSGGGGAGPVDSNAPALQGEPVGPGADLPFSLGDLDVQALEPEGTAEPE